MSDGHGPFFFAPEQFPTSGSLLTTTDSAQQQAIVARATSHAEMATLLASELRKRGWETAPLEVRVDLIHFAEESLRWWRFAHAQRDGAQCPERVLVAVTNDEPQYIQLSRRYDDATWTATQTPASHAMDVLAAVALDRFANEAPDADVLPNVVQLDDAGYVGIRLLQGEPAVEGMRTLMLRVEARVESSHCVDADGTRLVVATGDDAHRTMMRRAARILLAADPFTLSDWITATYLLCQAPRWQLGADETDCVLAMTLGALQLGAPPRIPHDLMLRGKIMGQEAFMQYLLQFNHA